MQDAPRVQSDGGASRRGCAASASEATGQLGAGGAPLRGLNNVPAESARTGRAPTATTPPRDPVIDRPSTPRILSAGQRDCPNQGRLRACRAPACPQFAKFARLQGGDAPSQNTHRRPGLWARCGAHGVVGTVPESSVTGPSTPKGASQSSAPLRRDAWVRGGPRNKGELFRRSRARGRATRHATKDAGNGPGARIQGPHFSRREPVCSERHEFVRSNVWSCEGKIAVLGQEPRKRASNHLSAPPETNRGVWPGATVLVVCMETRTSLPQTTAAKRFPG